MRCKHCGEPAGWLSSEHDTCANAYRRGSAAMERLARSFVLTGIPFDFDAQFEALAVETHNSPNRDQLRLTGARTAWEEHFAASTPNEAIENDLYDRTKRIISLDQQESLPLKKVEMRAVLRAISQGERLLPSVAGHLMFPDAKKGEFFVWDFENCNYYEEKIHKHIEGRSSGTSVRIMRGVSVRVGQYQGRVVETTSLDPVDSGSLLITSRRLHFRGAHKTFKIFFDKLALIEPYSDGLKIIRNTTTARPQVFAFNDGWFLNEVLSKL